MIRIKYILPILFLFLSIFSFAQAKNKYCIYDQVAVEKYGEKDYTAAKSYIDSAILMCEDLQSDPYVYHIKGFIYYELYKASEVEDPYSTIRAEAFDAFLKSNELDPEGIYREKNNKSLRNICVRIQQNIVHNLDTVQFKEAMKLNDLYHDRVAKSGVNLDLKEHDISFNNFIGNVYVELYENNKASRVSFIDSAIKHYEIALSIDTLGFDANKNLGYLYHNLSIDIILNMNPEDDILTMYENQERSSALGMKSLPYLKRAHDQRPKNRDVLYGLAGIYFMLQEKEKSDFYQKLYDEVSNQNNPNNIFPPDNDN